LGEKKQYGDHKFTFYFNVKLKKSTVLLPFAAQSPRLNPDSDLWFVP